MTSLKGGANGSEKGRQEFDNVFCLLVKKKCVRHGHPGIRSCRRTRVKLLNFDPILPTRRGLEGIISIIVLLPSP